MRSLSLLSEGMPGYFVPDAAGSGRQGEGHMYGPAEVHMHCARDTDALSIGPCCVHGIAQSPLVQLGVVFGLCKAVGPVATPVMPPSAWLAT